MIRRPPRSTLDRSSAASDVYKRQVQNDQRKERRARAGSPHDAALFVADDLDDRRRRRAPPRAFEEPLLLLPGELVEVEPPHRARLYHARVFRRVCGFLVVLAACWDPNPAQQGVDSGPVTSTIPSLSLIHISEPTRQAETSYAVFCLKK